SGGTFTHSSSTVMFVGTVSNGQIDTTAGTTFNNLTINDGLVGYWKLDETASPARDSSGYDNIGTWVNNVSGVTNTSSTIQYSNPRSAMFDGVSDYINLGNPDNISGLQAPMTITGWFNEDGTQTRPTILGQYLTTSNHQLVKLIRLDNDRLNYYASTAAGSFQSDAFSTTYSSNVWHFFAIRVSGSVAAPSLDMFVNETKESFAMAALSQTPDTDVETWIGWAPISSAAEDFGGMIDDVRIYNRALSDAEIQLLAAGSTPATALGVYTLQTDLDIDGTLMINSGELDIGSNRNINVAGNWMNHGGVFDEKTGTVTFDVQSGTVFVQEMQTFYHVTIDDTPGGTGTVEQYSPLDINGTLIITSGTLDAGSDNHTINLAGDWTNTGSYLAQSGTVDFDGTDQTITGATSFFNVNKIETVNDNTDTTLNFEAGTVFTLGGTLTLQGLDNDDRINLVSTVPGTRFTFDVTGFDQRVRFVDVSDSQTSSNDIIARRSIDNSNTDTQELTPHWIISPGDIYEWTSNGDAATWEDQGNWDFGDLTPGNDGYPDDNFDEALILLSADDIDTPSGTLTIAAFEMSSDFTGSVTLSGTMVVDNAMGLTGNVTIVTGTLTHLDNSTTETNKLVVLADGDFVLGAGARIYADGLGYDTGFGPGSPTDRNGGSYGGIGGDHEEDGTDGAVYGSLFAPVNLGSGGGGGIGGEGG
ncbi:MAG: LamG domain-containing protein, partial [Candidatus Omnitrophica bacterium]|nr:LamG domain-containing protein [Candidatus Omnitrophota bacterium]